LQKFPDWEFVVCIPKNIPPLSIIEEINFFNKSTPIKKNETLEILYVSLYGVAASIVEKDFKAFCVSINDLQRTKWKRLERLMYKGNIKRIENNLFKAGAKSVAMSSLGPSLIVFSDNIESFLFNSHKFSNELIFYKAKANNEGRLIYA
jgi:beta-ribofuranosylaminobenzene 5'-phosphate synthase